MKHNPNIAMAGVCIQPLSIEIPLSFAFKALGDKDYIYDFNPIFLFDEFLLFGSSRVSSRKHTTIIKSGWPFIRLCLVWLYYTHPPAQQYPPLMHSIEFYRVHFITLQVADQCI